MADLTNYCELLLGCGHSRVKRIPSPVTGAKWVNLVTLDNNRACKPDIVCDLDAMTQAGNWIAPDYWGSIVPGCIDPRGCILRSDYFNEVHAYEVLEHLGGPGDFISYFAHFSEIWRILKPDGLLMASVPSRFSEGLWGDPGHRRAITPMSLVFLDQSQYVLQCDRNNPTSMSDYRSIYKADFRVLDSHDDRNSFRFMLQAVKPSRLIP